MKKISLIILSSLFLINCLYSSPSIKGDFSLNSYVNIDNNFDITMDSNAEINLFLNSSSNNVKYTIKNSTLLFYQASSAPTTAPITSINTFEQAYLKFRIPYKESYLIFNFGKTPLDIGGDWLFNSGTPFETYSTFDPSTLTLVEAPNPWIASVKHKLFQNENFESLNIELIAKLPIEDDDSKIGGRLTYDINNNHFGTIETSLLTDKSESILSGGYSGTLYFDYGIYGKIDLQDIDDYEASFYLLKLIEDYTIKFEALYDNEASTYILLPSFSYNIDSKSTASLALNAARISDSWTLIPTVSLNQNIVQGLDFTLNYYYTTVLKHTLGLTITHKF